MANLPWTASKHFVFLKGVLLLFPAQLNVFANLLVITNFNIFVVTWRTVEPPKVLSRCF